MATIGEEQRKLEEEEEEHRSESASLNESMLDESMEDDNYRDPAVTRSASRRLATNQVSGSAAADADPASAILPLIPAAKPEANPASIVSNSSLATPKGGPSAIRVSRENLTTSVGGQAMTDMTSPKGGQIKRSDTYEAISLYKRTSSSAPNLLGGARKNVDGSGSLYSAGDQRCSGCFVDLRFHQKLNIMMSFDPNDLECSCCPGKILVDHKSVLKSERRVFVLTDQYFPASARADSSRGQCLKIIRVENGSLWEIFGIFFDTVRKGGLHVPAGSVVLLGSASHLADVGLSAYSEELCAVVKRIHALQGGCIYFSPCPMLLMDGTTSSMMIRAIVELGAWCNFMFSDTVSYCPSAMNAATGILWKRSTGDCMASSARMMLPSDLGSGTNKKKWESGGTNLPAGVPPLSPDDEKSIIFSLILDLNERLGLKLDPTPNLSREVEAGGADGRPQILVVGASNAARTADALERAGADVLRAITPGWRCMKQKVPAMVDLVKQRLEEASPGCVVVYQLYDSSFHFARTEEGSLVPACKSPGDGRFHTHGEAVVAPKESQFAAFSATKGVLEAAGKLQRVLISPLPRHLFTGCCSDQEHCSNIGSDSYREETEASILACRKNLKDFCFRHNIRGCKVLCPWSHLRKRAEELWSTEDPVHMVPKGFDLLADLVMEAVAGASDEATLKRPPLNQEANLGKRAHH